MQRRKELEKQRRQRGERWKRGKEREIERQRGERRGKENNRKQEESLDPEA